MSSSTHSGLPPPSTMYSIAAADYNNSNVSMMLFGMYSIIYIFTVYIYWRRKGVSKGNIAIIATITALYLINTSVIVSGWITGLGEYLRTIGQPIDVVFLVIEAGSQWNTLLVNFSTLFTLSLADGLLIWRCYNVWGESVYSIVIPIFFLLVETALNLSVIIISCMNNISPPPNIAVLLDRLAASAMFTSLGSTILTTSLIAYRIYSVSRGIKKQVQRRPFVAILDTIVQSAAAYMVVTLLYAIEGIIPFTSSSFSTLFNLQGYTYSFFSTIAGVAPTIMVAKVALATPHSDRNRTTNAISDLEFNRGPSSESTPIPNCSVPPID